MKDFLFAFVVVLAPALTGCGGSGGPASDSSSSSELEQFLKDNPEINEQSDEMASIDESDE